MALSYLLCPTFQIENTAGKPATGGWLEVYIAGSRTRYYCASDFNGTLHPFRIELDSLGSNVVLADDSNAYDVYVYNRYGSLMMSRYGVKPGAGGGISSATITSTDGSILVTPTASGVDLRVDAEPPTSMRCSASDLQESGTFEFVQVQRDGMNASVNNNGQVVVNSGWWHYDAVVRLKWPANPAENITSSVSLYAPDGSSSSYFDRSYSHDETLQLSGEYKCTQDGTVFPVGIQDVPSGMTVELVDFGIHSVTGEGAGGVYTAGDGILIDEPNRVISIDPETVQGKLTAGNNITIEDNVISATAEPQQQADWAQSDSTAVDYIKNKPDLSVYATTQAMNTALAGKQDTISDLDAIRSGAQAGSTAVQPAALADYQEKLTAGSNISISANNEISATDTTYSAGTGLGLTGTTFSVDTTTIATKSDLPIQQQLVPGYSLPADEGKVLTAGSTTYWSSLSDYVTDTELGTILEGYQTALTAGSNIQISNGTISATDTTYTAGTALSLTGTEFSVKVDGTTVTVNSSGELQAAPAITVDQTYDATSTNPQSGTAVAQAVAGVDTGLFEATYGTTTLSDIQSAISAHKIVYCRASGRMAFLAYIGSRQVEFQYYRSNAGGTGDSVFVYTVNSNGWTTTERPAYVQSDWSTSDASAASYIKNKPDLSVYATTASLGAVAFSNDYDDLDNKPSIPVLPATKDLVAGNNITLTEGNDDVTVACSITIGVVTV